MFRTCQGPGLLPRVFWHRRRRSLLPLLLLSLLLLLCGHQGIQEEPWESPPRKSARR